uniref:Uncharacterized protein n=1 Tax=Leersia perrieri TaxID=77586 RepID=A0A0D9VKP3_9ORYZ
MEMGRDVVVEGQQQRRVVVGQVQHSQVRRIKQEEGEKVKVEETYQNQAVSEMRARLVLRDMEARQRSRSPLGRATARPAISIGGDS